MRWMTDRALDISDLGFLPGSVVMRLRSPEIRRDDLATPSFTSLYGVPARCARVRAQEKRKLMTNADIWPTEIRLSKDRKTVTVGFEDGSSFDLPAEYLRVMSPSAEVQGHSAAEQARPCRASATSRSCRSSRSGNYAVRLVFDDMHQTGLFTWDYLRELGQKDGEKWQAIWTSWRPEGHEQGSEPSKRRP